MDVPGRGPRAALRTRGPPRRTRSWILCTGSQGEPLSALTRIAYNDHPAISVERGDTVIISAKPMPGNELRVHDTINQLARSSARRCSIRRTRPCTCRATSNVEELRTMLGAACGRRRVMPVHGEYRMLAAHAQLARGRRACPPTSIVIAENGDVVELSRDGRRASPTGSTPGVTFVDGLGVGDVARRGASATAGTSPRTASLIVVATLASQNGGAAAPPELIVARRSATREPIARRAPHRGRPGAAQTAWRRTSREIKLLQEHLHDGVGQLRVRPHAPAADDPAGHRRDLTGAARPSVL